MRITIPKIRLPLDLGGYSSDNEGQLIYVWVNPPRRLKDDFFRETYLLGNGSNPGAKPGDKPILESWRWLTKLRKDHKRKTLSNGIVKRYASLWSYTEDGEDIDKEEIFRFADQIQDLDPAMWVWMTTQTWIMIRGFLEAAKKAPTMLS
jgi:hypothetical protein